MKEWTLHITYHHKSQQLKSVVEYQSLQIMRIRVYGSKSSLLLENDYPIIAGKNSKKGIKWKIREGKMAESREDNSSLLMEIIKQLEQLIKKDYPPNDILFN